MIAFKAELKAEKETGGNYRDNEKEMKIKKERGIKGDNFKKVACNTPSM